MASPRFRVIVGLGLCAAGTLWSIPAAAERSKVAVMTLVDPSKQLDATVVEGLTDALRARFAQCGRFVVIDKSRQAQALREMIGKLKRESYGAQYDSRYQIPLGQALAADTILRTKVILLGSTLTLNAELVDISKEAVTGAAQASVRALPRYSRDDRLLRGVTVVAERLCFGSDPLTRRATPAPPVLQPRRPPPTTHRARPVVPEGKITRRAPAPPSGHQGADPGLRRKRVQHLVYGWLTLGSAAVASGLGAYYLTAKVAAEEERADQAGSPGELAGAADQAKAVQKTGWIMLGVGIGAAVTGTILLLTAPALPSEGTQRSGVAAVVTDDGFQLGLNGRF